MRLKFTKMHGLGNDFVVLNGMDQAVELDREQIRRIADRRLGVGCDQLLMIHPARDERADFLYTIFNADGSEAEHCGNGIRCVAVFLRSNQLTDKQALVAETGAGLLRVFFEDAGLVRVDMGRPRFRPADEPPAADGQREFHRLELERGSVDVMALSLGNPHAVLIVEDAAQAPVDEIGTQIQRHALFPDGANVGFMQILDNSHIKLRVFERGVGETPACGSAACAAAAVAIRTHKLDANIDVSLPGGHLAVSWAGDVAPVWLTGPAEAVYEGQIRL